MSDTTDVCSKRRALNQHATEAKPRGSPSENVRQGIYNRRSSRIRPAAPATLTNWPAMPEMKRSGPDLGHHDPSRKRQRAGSDSLSLSSPIHDNPVATEVISNQATPTQSLALLPSSPQTALKVVLGELRDSLSGLPSLQMAVGGLLDCIIRSEVGKQARRAYSELASDLANLATLLQRHAFELKPHDEPYSIANVVQAINKQTKLIRTQQEQQRTGRLTTAKEDEEAVLECYRRVGALYQHLQTGISSGLHDESKVREMDTLMKELSQVYEAYHNAALPTSATTRVECTQGTRVDILNTAWDWARGRDMTKIFWLNGMAGTGKTTIAYTLCEMLQRDNLLAASFFCSRNSTDCQNANRIVPTIAYQLGQYSSVYRQELVKALKSHPDTSKRNIGTQFKHLISEPFERAGQRILKDVVVVIDALDECADDGGTKSLLSMLIRHAAQLPIRFFIASRPEPTISDSMEARTGASRSILWLHDIAKWLVQADIKLYLAEALESIDISPSEIDQLAAKAGKLFIFAATAVRYIRPDRGAVNHRKRLLEVLELQLDTDNLRHQDIDTLYTTILSNALNEKVYTKTELTTRQRVLWAVVCAKEPLTIPALAELLDIAEEDTRPAILALQSVLHQSESSGILSALHASFPNFLLTKERARRFYCNEVIQNSYLADCCFRSMSRLLKFNICGLESSYVLDKDIPDLQSRVEKAITTGLFYSSRYWSEHLTRCPPSTTLLLSLDLFLQQHLLFWMEVLNLKGQIGHGDVVLSQVLAWLPTEDDWTELRDFTFDARNFVTCFAGNPTSLSTPHIYVSTLSFTSRQSRVRMTYWQQTQGLLEIDSTMMETRCESVLATWIVGSEVYSIAQSSDGRRVVSGSEDDGVGIWDVFSGACTLGPLQDHEGAVYSVAVSPDNTRIASGSEDRTIRVWDACNGDLVIGPLRGHTSDVNSVAFSLDGTRIASGSSDCTIRMWDAYTGAAIGDAFEGHQNAVWSVVFSPDGRHLASGSYDCTIRVWNWRTGALALGPIEEHTDPVLSIAYSSDGLRLASGSGNLVRVWDTMSGALLAGPFEGHAYRVTSVSFLPNDTQLVSGSIDGTIQVWEAKSGELLAGPFQTDCDSIRAVLFTIDETRILSGSEEGMIRVRDARHRTTAVTESLPYLGDICSVAISPDGAHVASGSYKTICVWDARNGALVAGPFEGHDIDGTIYSVAFSPDGARIVSGGWDCTLRTWDSSTGVLLAGPFEGHTEWVSSVAFSPDGSQIASGSWDHTIRLWDPHTGESVAEPFQGHTSTVESVAFSPNGTRIVSSSFDKTVRMWATNDGTALWTSDAHTCSVYSVAFSPNGKRVVSGSDDKTILVLDAGDGAVLHGPFTGHTSWIRSVAFSSDGTRIVSGSYDQTVRVWDVESGAVVIGPLKGHTQCIESVVFSPDGTRIVSGSEDGTIRFWDVAAAAEPDATSFDGWTLGWDGWLIDSQSRLLFWVPPDLQERFWFPTPSNPAVSNARSTTRVEDTTLLGNRWHGCYDISR